MLSAIITSDYISGRSVQKGLDFCSLKTLVYKTNFPILDSYDFTYHDGFFVYLISPTEQHVNFCLHLKNIIPGRNIFILLKDPDIEVLNMFKESVGLPIFLSPFVFENISESFQQYTMTGHNDSQDLVISGVKLTLNSSTRLLSINNQFCLKLVNKEFYIMKFFFSNRGRVVSKLDMLENVWGKNLLASTDTIDVHVSRLRKKLKNFVEADLIKTIPCAGYIFE